MPLKITTLCENTATFGFLAEFGLSIHVEVRGQRFLLDTGRTRVAVENARQFNICLQDLNAIILSHGHSDHTGGLVSVLKETGPIPVIAHPGIFAARFSARHKPKMRNISMPETRSALESAGARFQFHTAPGEIAPGIFISGEVPMKTAFEKVDSGLLTKGKSGFEPDLLPDDLSVGIQTDKGLFILVGCAHRGVVNIVTHFQTVTGEQRVYGILGGLHLSRVREEHISQVIEFFQDIGVRKIACSHCTGFHASARLEAAFKGNFILNHSGKKLVFNLD